MKLLDVVVLIEDLPELALYHGQVGTIILGDFFKVDSSLFN